jgi:Ca2+-binding RTX toxin-like protein
MVMVTATTMCSGVVPANALGEIDAFAQYFEERYATPETAYDEADTPATLDTRIQNQAVRTDTVLEGEYVTLGTPGNDVMNGTAGTDKLKGLAGNDRLNSTGGADILIGGLGGAGTDTASYENAASGVSVSLLSGRGTFGEAVGDHLFSFENSTGSPFDDVLTGNSQANVIHGGSGNDVIEGEGGADQLFGD